MSNNERFRGYGNKKDKLSDYEFHIRKLKSYEVQIQNLQTILNRGTMVKMQYDPDTETRIPVFIPLTEKQLREREMNLEVLSEYYDGLLLKIPGLSFNE